MIRHWLTSFLHRDRPIHFDRQDLRLADQATLAYLGTWRPIAPPIIRRERKPTHEEVMADRERRAAAMRHPLPFRRRA